MRTMVLCHATPDKRRPDWRKVMRGSITGAADRRDNEMVAVTRGTLRMAESALRSRNALDYQNTSGAAEAEVVDALQNSLVDS